MDLLSAKQLLRIKKSIKDVTDTFHKQPISILIDNAIVQRWKEDATPGEYTTYNILSRVTYGTNTSDAALKDDVGDVDRTRMFVTVDTRNLADIGFPLLEGDLPNISIGNSFIIYKQKKYEITVCTLQGAFDQQSLLARFEVDINKYYDV